MSEVSKERLERARAKHGEDVGAHEDKNIMIKVSKDKKSQALDSRSNIFVITNKVKSRKYAISLNANVITTTGEKVTEVDPYLDVLQDKFCEFLALLRSEVELDESTKPE